jgi:diguanylate cyclase (GGDEF)-like protein
MVAVSAVVLWRNFSLRRKLRQERHRADEAARLAAWFDDVTGLPSSVLLLDRLQHSLARARRLASGVSVLFVEIDDFLPLDEQLGRAGGDQLLRVAANRLSQCVRETDTVARLSGAEFAVLLTDISDRSASQRVASRILLSLERPVEIDGKEHRISASIGISHSRSDGDDGAALLRKADAAMARARSGGRRICVYASSEPMRN